MEAHNCLAIATIKQFSRKNTFFYLALKSFFPVIIMFDNPLVSCKLTMIYRKCHYTDCAEA